DHPGVEFPGQAEAWAEIILIRLYAAGLRKRRGPYRDHRAERSQEIGLTVVDLSPGIAGKELIAQSPIESECGREPPAILDEDGVFGTAEAARAAERADVPACRQPQQGIRGSEAGTRGGSQVLREDPVDGVNAVRGRGLQQVVAPMQNFTTELEGVR